MKKEDEGRQKEGMDQAKARPGKARRGRKWRQCVSARSTTRFVYDITVNHMLVCHVGRGDCFLGSKLGELF